MNNMKKATFLRKMLWLLFVPFLAMSCEDKMDEHYEVPDWVPGSAWEVLSSGEHGNYSIFLEGVELAGYRAMLEGKSILTVMAPDDEAFQDYLSKKGYASIKDMPSDELKKLIGYHLLYYSYNKENLVNFRPNGVGTGIEEEENNDAGLYYKHRTKSADAPTLEMNPATGSQVMVYHRERFIPVFSYRYFQTLGIDAKSSYEYFYPNSTWTGDDGFNVSNASVKEYGIIANNGYIHTVKQVVEPLETIHTELAASGDYSTFLSLYDASGYYEANDELTESYAAAYGVDTLYQYKHALNGLPNIACEWAVDDMINFNYLTRVSYTVFAPSNAAIDDFFNRFWKVGGYTSLDEVDKLAMNSLVRSYICNGTMIFPQLLEKTNNEIYSVEGTTFNISFDQIAERHMCVNGAMYGMNHIDTPVPFASVMGPVFQYKDARSFLYAMNGAGVASSYISPEAKYIMIVPNSTQFENSGIYTVYGNQSLEEDTEDGRAEISTTSKQNIVYMHSASIASQASSDLPASGTAVIPLMANWNFWFVKDGKITCNAMFNRQLNPENVKEAFATFTKLADESNGTVYKTDAESLFEMETGNLTRSMAICADKRYVYYNFVQLLKKANLIVGENLMSVFGKGRYVAFIPTNDAIQKALTEGRIPGATNASFDAEGNLTGTFDAEVLKNYLNSYFITSTQNVIMSYPYPGSTFKSGKYWSERVSTEDGVLPPALNYEDNGTSLSIQLEGFRKCNVVTTYSYFPFAYEDGCFHLIDDVF